MSRASRSAGPGLPRGQLQAGAFGRRALGGELGRGEAGAREERWLGWWGWLGVWVREAGGLMKDEFGGTAGCGCFGMRIL